MSGSDGPRSPTSASADGLGAPAAAVASLSAIPTPASTNGVNGGTASAVVAASSGGGGDLLDLDAIFGGGGDGGSGSSGTAARSGVSASAPSPSVLVPTGKELGAGRGMGALTDIFGTSSGSTLGGVGSTGAGLGAAAAVPAAPAGVSGDDDFGGFETPPPRQDNIVVS